jgi:prephenate dehydrogenase
VNKNVHIIGAGLLGGSIALALSEAGWRVSVEDATAESTAESVEKLALAHLQLEVHQIDVVIVSVPISANAATIKRALESYPNAIVIEISSVKTKSLPDVETNPLTYSRFVSSHPFAGKETHGASNANVALFQDRVWAICRGSYLTESSKAVALRVLQDCGAIPVEIEMQDHDKVVAYTSHLPQIIATLLSSQMEHLPEDLLRLSGNGLSDMTRLALSSPQLWTEIVTSNATNLHSILDQMKKSIEDFQVSLSEENIEHIHHQFVLGKDQKKRLPGKHGEVFQDFAKVEVQILDQPGELAKLFHTAFVEEINIEDLRINHALGRNLAILEVFISKNDVSRFTDVLLKDGWKVRSIQNSTET